MACWIRIRMVTESNLDQLFRSFMEPEGSLLFSQVSRYAFKFHININTHALFSLRLGLQSYFLSVMNSTCPVVISLI